MTNGTAVPVSLLVVVFGAAVVVRAALAGPQGAASRPAGLVFAGVLATLAVVSRTPTRISRRAVFAGAGAAVLLVVPALLHVSWTTARPASALPAWAVATAVVATAEEAFLRGALFDAVTARRGTDVAIVVCAVAFGLLHVPFYGWHALPLDMAVGGVLGVVRTFAGTWTAPAIAHVGADLAGWWLL